MRGFSVMGGVVLSAVVTTSALADPVLYKFTGRASGSIGGVTFADSAFEILMDGDTSTIFTNPGGFQTFTDTTTTFSIDGFVNGATINDEFSLVANHVSDVLVLGNWVHNSARVIMDIPAVENYDLSAPFGPVTDDTPGATFQFNFEDTSAGVLDLSGMTTVTFEAIGIPAPGALGVLALSGIMIRRRR